MANAGLIFRRARLFGRMWTARTLHLRRPIVAYLLLTDRCNMHCRYCFVDCNTHAAPEELSEREWMDLIDELHRRGTGQICLMGGEPLIHAAYDAIVERVKSLGMICDTTTNGLLLPKKLETMKKLDSVMISLDGGCEANDVNRMTLGGQGTFNKVVDAIRVAREAGITVRVNAVMTRQSRGDIGFLLDLADEYGLYVTFAITAEFPEYAENEAREIVLSADEIIDLYRDIKRYKRQGRRVLFSDEALDYVIHYPLPHDEVILRDDPVHAGYYPRRCPFGQTMFYVHSNGDFYPCAKLWNSPLYRPMNLRRDGFEAAWNHMGPLKCQACSSPGLPDWNRITSLGGVSEGLRLTLRQVFGRNGRTMGNGSGNGSANGRRPSVPAGRDRVGVARDPRRRADVPLEIVQ